MKRIKINEVLEIQNGKMVVSVTQLEDEPFDPNDLEIRAYKEEIKNLIRNLLNYSPTYRPIRDQLETIAEHLDLEDPSNVSDATILFTNSQPQMLQVIRLFVLLSSHILFF